MITKLFDRVLIANRGEIACRIIKTCQRLGIETLAICSEADQASLHTKIADQTVVLRGNEAKDTYLNKDSLLKLAKEYRVDAVHPGYGFLSENCDFASACNDSGITFIGPSIDTISRFGHKEQARELAVQNSVPVLPGSTNLNSVEQAKAYANQIGYPILIKCSSGGGGIGMLLCHNDENLETMFDKAKTTGRHYFSNPDIFIEKYITNTRHIEVQIFGDSQGNITVLGERECSIQRRYQKIIEETPSPFINDELRSALFACARQLAKAVEYRSAGTVEFIVDVDTGKFYFLEVNTRLQVEHTITEEVGNIDLVEWMLRQAADDNFSVANFSWKPKGHAIQVRVYAEDPSQNFQPATGRLSNVTQANNPWDRYDTGVETGFIISPYYDPLLAKIIVKGTDRSQALERLTTSLNNTRFDGIVTNLDYLKQLAVTSEFVAGNYTTLLTESFDYQTCDIEVMDGGLYTTIQDYPGRMGVWDVGVPPSGPMDDEACRVANLLVGNSEGSSALEITLQGPILKFRTATVFALTGADMDACLNDEPIALYQTHYAKKGSILKVKTAVHGGYRCYLAVRGGFDLPTYLDSQATFPMAQLGGLNGTPLAMGEYLPLCRNVLQTLTPFATSLPRQYWPIQNNTWEVGVLFGPHGTEDFLTKQDMEMFFDTSWKVHHNSNRLGIRLLGPNPQWARNNGGEAGLHPSNIHDCEYAIGSINFSGDTPIILTNDGPSLGGFVCPVTICEAEMWKVGQFKPNDKIRFKLLNHEQARELKYQQNERLKLIRDRHWESYFDQNQLNNGGILYQQEKTATSPQIIVRMAGDRYLLIEYGPLVLDLDLRFRVHALMEWFKARDIIGVLELSPGVRSLQISYDNEQISLARLLDIIIIAEQKIGLLDDQILESRVIKLPIALDDPWNKGAIERYQKSVRKEAPYLPCNLEFIARMNGLNSKQKVLDIICQAQYMVLGLGDVYLGAPCAVPLDPRHRLLTSKYNPARTYTPEGSVGIGGAYMCIYGMESPGGYQLVGRTIPIWDQYTQNRNSKDGKPWLLRFFDRIQFYLVSANELVALRRQYSANQLQLEIENQQFRVADYHQFLEENQGDIEIFRNKQQIAFNKEVQHWHDTGMIGGEASIEEENQHHSEPEEPLPEGVFALRAASGGCVLSLLAEVGDTLEKDQDVVVFEAMKMEYKVATLQAGKLEAYKVQPGDTVHQGQIIALVKAAS